MKKSLKVTIFILIGILVIGIIGITFYANGVIFPKSTVVPSTFDPTAIEAAIGAGNSVQMTFAEYEKIAPSLWEEQNKTMTIALPVTLKNNRTPNLLIEKEQVSFDSSESPVKKKITIDGLQQGDVILSPVDGEILISQGGQDLNAFRISTKDSQGNSIVIWFSTTGLNPLINFKRPVKENISIYIKKGDPIGSLLTSDKHPKFNGQIQIDGFAPLLNNFNLATTPEGKVIILR
jgi:hypothetical protein